MSPLAAWLVGVGALVAFDGVLCLAAPKILKQIYHARSLQSHEQMAARGRLLLAAGAGLLLVAGAVL